MKSTPLSDAIWNRATERLPPDAPRGDRALGDALGLHGLVMNGGLDHGLDVMSAEGVERAAAGFGITSAAMTSAPYSERR